MLHGIKFRSIDNNKINGNGNGILDKAEVEEKKRQWRTARDTLRSEIKKLDIDGDDQVSTSEMDKENPWLPINNYQALKDAGYSTLRGEVNDWLPTSHVYMCASEMCGGHYYKWHTHIEELNRSYFPSFIKQSQSVDDLINANLRKKVYGSDLPKYDLDDNDVANTGPNLEELEAYLDNSIGKSVSDIYKDGGSDESSYVYVSYNENNYYKNFSAAAKLEKDDGRVQGKAETLNLIATAFGDEESGNLNEMMLFEVPKRTGISITPNNEYLGTRIFDVKKAKNDPEYKVDSNPEASTFYGMFGTWLEEYNP